MGLAQQRGSPLHAGGEGHWPGLPPMGRQRPPPAAQVGRAGKAPAARQTPAGAWPSPPRALLSFPSLSQAVQAELGFPEVSGWRTLPRTPLPGLFPRWAG